MLRHLLSALLGWLLFVVPAHSQEPIYGLYWQNPFIYNPAYTGAERELVAVITYRHQWLGIEEAPQSYNLGVHAPVGKNLSVGLNLQQQSASLFSLKAARLSLAYELQLSPNTYLRTAVATNGLQQSLDLAEANAEQLAYLSERNLNVPGSGIQFLAGAYLLYHNWLEIGFSFLNLTGQLPFNNTKIKPYESYFASARVRRPMGENLEISSGIMMQQFQPEEVRTEASALVYWNQKAWLGGGYRLNSGPLILAGFKIKNNFTLGYGYEISTNLAQGFGKDTHEIQLKYNYAIPKKEIVPEHRPRYDY